MTRRSRPLAVFRADGSEQMGGGHIIRCLSLASELARRGFDAVFLCARLTPFLRSRIIAAGAELAEIEPADGLVWDPKGWDSRQLSAREQQMDAQRCRTALAGRSAAWVIVDHYQLDQAWEKAFASPHSTVVIDDLANRPHDCGLLVDQTFGRNATDYGPLVPTGCRIFAGARFAMLGSNFTAARDEALARRDKGGEVKRILLSLGTSTVGQPLVDVAKAVAFVAGNRRIDVIASSTGPHWQELAELSAINPAMILHTHVEDMVPYVLAADVAIGAAGTAVWERCCLALPSISLVLADNQQLVARKLAEAGALRVVADAGECAEALAILLADECARLRMVAAAAAITDGLGAARVARAILDVPSCSVTGLKLREATEKDARDTWLWRNDPHTRAAARSHDPIAWRDHAVWWNSALEARGRRLMVAEANGQSVAMIRFDRQGLDKPTHEVSINVSPDARGRGIGRAVLAAGIEEIERTEGPVRFGAVIHKENVASQRIFTALGFEPAGSLAQDGFGRYVRQPKKGAFR